MQSVWTLDQHGTVLITTLHFRPDLPKLEYELFNFDPMVQISDCVTASKVRFLQCKLHPSGIHFGWNVKRNQRV
ncbi:unnamed protein product [Lathyrus oleraceus]